MARSLWKGKIFIKDFINPGYLVSKANYFKLLKPIKAVNSYKQFDELKIYRRNHVLLNSQIPLIRTLPAYLLYNGYDFIKRVVPNSILVNETSILLNLGATVTSREMQVTHKVKLSKATRKNNAKLKKRTSVLSKSNTKIGNIKKKVSLSKTIKK